MRGTVWSRTAFAAALTTFMVGSLVSFGGVSYAAQGAANTFHAVKRVTTTSHPRVRTLSSAGDQYSSAAPIAVKASKPKAKPPASPVVTSGELPFTGVSLVATTVLGFALLALGILLRRRERRQT